MYACVYVCVGAKGRLHLPSPSFHTSKHTRKQQKQALASALPYTLLSPTTQEGKEEEGEIVPSTYFDRQHPHAALFRFEDVFTGKNKKKCGLCVSLGVCLLVCVCVCR